MPTLFPDTVSWPHALGPPFIFRASEEPPSRTLTWMTGLDARVGAGLPSETQARVAELSAK